MSKKEKRIERLKNLPTDYTWSEACALLNQLGFIQLEGSGSRVKFSLSTNNNIENDCENELLISLHKPHPSNVMPLYAVKILCKQLQDNGLI